MNENKFNNEIYLNASSFTASEKTIKELSLNSLKKRFIANPPHAMQ